MSKTILILLLVGVLTACVTINIYFPAAAAQEVADEIIDDVWQIKKEAEGEVETPTGKPDTSSEPASENKTDPLTPASN